MEGMEMSGALTNVLRQQCGRKYLVFTLCMQKKAVNEKIADCGGKQQWFYPKIPANMFFVYVRAMTFWVFIRLRPSAVVYNLHVYTVAFRMCHTATTHSLSAKRVLNGKKCFTIHITFSNTKCTVKNKILLTLTSHMKFCLLMMFHNKCLWFPALIP